MYKVNEFCLTSPAEVRCHWNLNQQFWHPMTDPDPCALCLSTETARWRIRTAPCTKWAGTSVSECGCAGFPWSERRWHLHVFLLIELMRVARSHVMNCEQSASAASGADGSLSHMSVLSQERGHGQQQHTFTQLHMGVDIFHCYLCSKHKS